MAAPRLNGPFKYRSSVETDIRRTFQRVRRQLAEAAAATVEPPAPAPALPAADVTTTPRVRRVL
jgi:hypothetical protein